MKVVQLYSFAPIRSTSIMTTEAVRILSHPLPSRRQRQHHRLQLHPHHHHQLRLSVTAAFSRSPSMANLTVSFLPPLLSELDTVVTTLGSGSFGHVDLVRDHANSDEQTNAVRAEGRIETTRRRRGSTMTHIMNEKSTWLRLRHPIIDRLLTMY